VAAYSSKIQNYIWKTAAINRAANPNASSSGGHLADFCSALAGVKLNFHLSEAPTSASSFPQGGYRIEKFSISVASYSREAQPEFQKFHKRAVSHISAIQSEIRHDESQETGLAAACYKDVAVVDITIGRAQSK
jgi:hypothetical protein